MDAKADAALRVASTNELTTGVSATALATIRRSERFRPTRSSSTGRRRGRPIIGATWGKKGAKSTASDSSLVKS